MVVGELGAVAFLETHEQAFSGNLREPSVRCLG